MEQIDSQPIISVQQLTKYYGKVRGVEALSFDVFPGEVFGFLGPNGAGKTTTIRLLMNLLNPDAGTITLFSTPVTRRAFVLREQIGYLPGDFSPYSNMTGEEFLTYISTYRQHPPKLRKQLQETLQINSDLLSRKIKHLSHGNRQKLGIIMALEHDPDLAILDEPTGGLDPLMQNAFYEILKDFQERGKTIFLSSHILPEVEKTCSRVAIIREGRIVAVETIDLLKQKRPRRLVVEIKQGAGAPPPLIPGARFIKQEGNSLHYLVEGELHAILYQLARMPVLDVIFPEPDLEDIFLAYYRESHE